jgi:hypothetical protein
MKKMNVNSPEYRSLVTSLLGKDVKFEDVPISSSSAPKETSNEYVEKSASDLYHSLNKSLFADLYPQYKNRPKDDEKKFVKAYKTAVFKVDPKLAEEDEDYWNNLTDPVMKSYRRKDKKLLDNDEADMYMETMDSLQETYNHIVQK